MNLFVFCLFFFFGFFFFVFLPFVFCHSFVPTASILALATFAFHRRVEGEVNSPIFPAADDKEVLLVPFIASTSAGQVDNSTLIDRDQESAHSAGAVASYVRVDLLEVARVEHVYLSTKPVCLKCTVKLEYRESAGQ